MTDPMPPLPPIDYALIRKHFGDHAQFMCITKWKDGIDIKVPNIQITDLLEDYGQQCAAAANAEIERLRGVVQRYIDDFPRASFERACQERFGATPTELGQRLADLEHAEDGFERGAAALKSANARAEAAEALYDELLAENDQFQFARDQHFEARLAAAEEREAKLIGEMRRAVLVLGHAAEKDKIYEMAYQRLSDALAPKD
jgi:hypothetical protein